MTNSSAPPAPSAYSKKFNDPRWLRKKADILLRDGGCCRYCKSADAHLQVRFIAHRGIDPWEYPNEELETICVECSKLRAFQFDRLDHQLRILLQHISNDRLKYVVDRILADVDELTSR